MKKRLIERIAKEAGVPKSRHRSTSGLPRGGDPEALKAGEGSDHGASGKFSVRERKARRAGTPRPARR